MKKKSTLWIAIVMVALVAFFLKLAFTSPVKKTNGATRKGGKESRCHYCKTKLADQ